MNTVKNILVIIAVATLAWWCIYPMVDQSQNYWDNVGPNWDRMLNPCKYRECA